MYVNYKYLKIRLKLGAYVLSDISSQPVMALNRNYSVFFPHNYERQRVQPKTFWPKNAG